MKKPRIVKPRTAKQRAAARAFANRSPLKLSSNEGLPTSSWWAEPRAREEFEGIAATEAQRMRLSRLGQPAHRTSEVAE